MDKAFKAAEPRQKQWKKEVSVMKLVKKFFKDEQGLELVEYAVMTALIVAVLVTAIGLLSTAIVNRFGEVESVIDTIAT